MKLGIIGLGGSGKATVFEALTRNVREAGKREENRIGTIQVPDGRVDVLSEIYRPKKTIFATVEYFLPGKGEKNLLTQVRDCDALIHVIRNFSMYGLKAPDPGADFLNLEQEMVLADLVVAEKRKERMELDQKRGKKADPEEVSLINECVANLNDEAPLRNFQHIASAPVLRGFAFLTAKPELVLFNNEDEDEALPDIPGLTDRERCVVIRGKLEQELGQMSEEEAGVFLEEFNIAASATDRVIAQSYKLMGLISFFTVGDDEVRAWTIKKGTEAMDAAEVIHSDIKKGFIRAEVLHYDDLMDAGGYAEARKKGTVRLEGKTYEVKDGDIINFRFNV